MAPRRILSEPLNRLADFELTEAQYRELAALPEQTAHWRLRDMICLADHNVRSIPVPGIACANWQRGWEAEQDAHMERAWAAFERAAMRFGREAA